MELESQKVDELLELTRENNKMLRGMRRAQRFGSFFRLIYWMVILGSIFGTYYYFQPMIQKYMSVAQSSLNMLQQLESKAGTIPTGIDVQSLKNLMGR